MAVVAVVVVAVVVTQVAVVIDQPPLGVYLICTVLLIVMLVCIHYALMVSVGCESHGFGGDGD